jgi:alpha-L-fucosidase
MAVNSEGIYATRPWKVYGEGPSVTEKAESGTFGGARDVRSKPYTSEDVRFTTAKNGDTLYAFVLEWPADGRATIHSLGTNSTLFERGIASVSMLGSTESLEWTRDETGVHVTLPATRPCAEAFTIKVSLQ